MEGYSVTEAASVLGVPTERIWELLARGVLAGTPEGETGMRVFLQPRPAPAPSEPARPNGNGGDEPHRELSPFRELLTEFRNLTERYGQALLALGEARGEVAALRSRVDLLEARMDLRLPPGGATGPVGGRTPPMPWSSPRTEQPEPPHAPADSDSATDAPPAAADEAEPRADAEPRTLRRDSPRRATESFAEALARAQDPSPPELPGGPEASAAISALHRPATEDATSADAALPRELPPADEVPVADEVPEAHEGARDEVTLAEAESEQGEPPAALEAEAAPDGPEPGEAMPDVEADVEADGTEDAVAAPAESSIGRPAWQDERYTAEIGEPDWWEAEALPPTPVAGDDQPAPEETAHADEPPAPRNEPEGEGQAAREPEPGAMPEETTQPESAPATADAGPGTTVERPRRPSPGSLTRLRYAPSRSEEETVLRFGRSAEPAEQAETGEFSDADEMETAPASRSTDAAPAREPVALDDALAALESLSRATAPHPAAPEVGGRTAEEHRSGRAGQPIQRGRRQPPTPAGRAYRRLRRIFPG